MYAFSRHHPPRILHPLQQRHNTNLHPYDQLSYFGHSKPFKNPHYDRKTTGAIGTKRNRSLKQILVLERERIDKVLELKKLSVLNEEPDSSMQVDQPVGGTETEELNTRKRKEREEELMQVFSQVISYTSVEAPPSLMPPKKYCDVTGLEAKYVDPKSTLRYHNPEIYELVKTFQPAVIQAYLGVRGQGVVLR
ncbi:Ies6p [Sporobolomyces koalae]|uniref:Ies6p n=1 Tax=Sporobolomyces koalae TaxID=500713 RepID=UPI003174575F